MINKTFFLLYEMNSFFFKDTLTLLSQSKPEKKASMDVYSELHPFLFLFYFIIITIRKIIYYYCK